MMILKEADIGKERGKERNVPMGCPCFAKKVCPYIDPLFLYGTVRDIFIKRFQ